MTRKGRHEIKRALEILEDEIGPGKSAHRPPELTVEEKDILNEIFDRDPRGDGSCELIERLHDDYGGNQHEAVVETRGSAPE